MPSIGRVLDVSSSIAASLVRVASGSRVGTIGRRPAEPVILYEFEGCPFCRKVREALTILDLDADIRPCPKRGPRYREELIERGGKAMFPYLIDPNTGKEMYESNDIVKYLFSEYGNGSVPGVLAAGPLGDLSSILANSLRPARGAFYEPARAAEKPLELYSAEASPFCRIVREKLCTLELPYRLHNVATGSSKREAFVARSGKQLIPYLVDPNTGSEMFESADIVSYLERTYATG
jgi:glutathione S-transferase